MIIWLIIGAICVAAVAWLVAIVRRSKPNEQPAKVDIPDDCCGAHAVCERDSLLTKTSTIVYFDDEELDALAGRTADTFNESETQQIEEVFYTLREQDVAGWLRSLQLRNIDLPEPIRDAALLIVAERRNRKS